MSLRTDCPVRACSNIAIFIRWQWTQKTRSFPRSTPDLISCPAFFTPRRRRHNVNKLWQMKFVHAAGQIVNCDTAQGERSEPTPNQRHHLLRAIWRNKNCMNPYVSFLTMRFWWGIIKWVQLSRKCAASQCVRTQHSFDTFTPIWYTRFEIWTAAKFWCCLEV